MSQTKQTSQDGQTVEKLGRKRYERELASYTQKLWMTPRTKAAYLPG